MRCVVTSHYALERGLEATFCNRQRRGQAAPAMPRSGLGDKGTPDVAPDGVLRHVEHLYARADRCHSPCDSGSPDPEDSAIAGRSESWAS